MLLIPLVVHSSLMGYLYCRHWGEYGDGNWYIDPVVFILRYLSPVASLGVASLFVLRRHRKAGTRSVACASTVFFSFTIALVIYGIWFFHKVVPGYFLSSQVWWLIPFRLFRI